MGGTPYISSYGKIGWGVIGSGSIVQLMSAHMRRRPDVDMVAIASSTGRVFDDDYGFRLKTTVDDLLHNDDVQVVYVASANSDHAKFVSMALTARKHVLCERPMTMTHSEFHRLSGEATTHNRILMEGLFTAYLPGMQVLRSFTFGRPLSIEVHSNIKPSILRTSPILGRSDLGGGIFDGCGSYTTFALLSIVGLDYFQMINFDTVQSSFTIDENSIDLEATVTIHEPSWSATLHHSFSDLKRRSVVQYETASVEFELSKMDTFWVTRNDGISYTISVPDPLQTIDPHVGLNSELNQMHLAIDMGTTEFGAGVEPYTSLEMESVSNFMDHIRSLRFKHTLDKLASM